MAPPAREGFAITDKFFDVKSPYYSFNWGGAHFAMLDTDVSNVAVSSAERQVAERRETVARLQEEQTSRRIALADAQA